MSATTTKTKKGSTKKESKLSKIMKAPIRVLTKIKDFYILSMTEISAHFDHGTAVMGCPAAQVATTLPKSFSVSSTKSSGGYASDDYRELVKAASTRSLASKIELDFDKNSRQSPGPAAALPKSRSVGIARIDEDKPLDFDADDGKAGGDVFPRSRSYAVHRRKMV